MDLKELKTKTSAELHKLLAHNRAKVQELRFKDSNKQLKNVREIRVIKKLISQTLTVLNSQLKSVEVKVENKINKIETKIKSEDNNQVK